MSLESVLYDIQKTKDLQEKMKKEGCPENYELVLDSHETMAEYAKESVKALIGAGLVNGKSGKITPNDNTTRAEVAVVLNRILPLLNK